MSTEPEKIAETESKEVVENTEVEKKAEGTFVIWILLL